MMNTAAPIDPGSSVLVAGRPMRKDARRNQLLVIAAARDVLSELGDEATMEAIAARAGVGVGTVYRHYPNKAALFENLVEIIVDELIDTARRCQVQRAAGGLADFLSVLGQSFADHRGYADKLMRHNDDDRNQVLRDLIADLLRRAKDEGRVAAAITFDDVMATIAGLRGVINATATDPDSPAEPVWQRHLEIHLAGMRHQ